MLIFTVLVNCSDNLFHALAHWNDTFVPVACLYIHKGSYRYFIFYFIFVVWENMLCYVIHMFIIFCYIIGSTFKVLLFSVI